jgi:hypothetical protein
MAKVLSGYNVMEVLGNSFHNACPLWISHDEGITNRFSDAGPPLIQRSQSCTNREQLTIVQACGA